MSHRLTLTFVTRLPALGHVQDRVSRWLADHDASPETAYLVRLVVEEIGSNIIRYGYDDHAPHTVALTADLTDDSVTLTLEDDGRPFDPNSRDDRPAPESLEDAPTGGMGITLVRRLAGPIDYARVHEHNRTRVTIARA